MMLFVKNENLCHFIKGLESRGRDGFKDGETEASETEHEHILQKIITISAVFTLKSGICELLIKTTTTKFIYVTRCCWFECLDLD